MIYNYHRNESLSNEVDIVRIEEDDLVLNNEDGVSKNIDFKIISADNKIGKTYSISNTLLNPSDTLSCRINYNKEFILSNSGVAKNYDLEVVYQDSIREDLFYHREILLSENTVHKIVPAWDSLNIIKILIDEDQNGTFEDSIFVENQITSVDYGNNFIPTNYELYQNFPNPFNPSTRISYSIPELSNVTLKVYDILGNEITTLVNEQKSPGHYTVQFNSKNLSSGIYFYTLQTGNYTATKKMILLK